MNRESTSTEGAIRKRAGLRLMREQEKINRSSRNLKYDDKDEAETSPTPPTTTPNENLQTPVNSSSVKAYHPNAETSTKRVRFWSTELIKLEKNTAPKFKGQVKHRRIRRPGRLLYHRSDNLDEPPHLTVQTQEEIIRNLALSTVRHLVQEDFSPDANLRKSFMAAVEPLDIHLLTAKAGKITYDLADYIGTEMVGKKVAVKKERTSVSKASTIQTAALDALQETLKTARTPGSSIYPRCKTKPHNLRTIKHTLLKPIHRPLRSYRPSRRRLWVINPACAKSSDARPSEQDQSGLTLPSADVTISKKFKEAKPNKKTKQSEFNKLSIQTPLHDTCMDVTWNAEDGCPNLMLDELETMGEEEMQPEDELLTMLQADVEDDWDVLSQPRQSKKKSYHVSSGPKIPQGQSGLTRSSSSLLNNENRLGMMQNIQIFDTQSLTMGLQNLERRACIRRLVNLIAAECTPKSIFEKYVQDRRIVIDLTHPELAFNYGPRVLQGIKDQMTKVVGQPHVVLNDHSVMEKLKDRVREMYKNQLTELEVSMERKEADRIRTLLTRNVVDRDALDAELLRQGELRHAKRRTDPVILLQKVSFGHQMLPLFCLNPLKEEYRFSHLENETELLKHIPRRSKLNLDTAISRRRRKSKTSIHKKHRRGGHRSSAVAFEVNSPAINETYAKRSTESESFEESSVDINKSEATRLLPQLSLGVPALDSCLKSQPETSDLFYDDHVVKLYHAARLVLRQGSDAEISLTGYYPNDDSKATSEGIEIQSSAAESIDIFNVESKRNPVQNI